MMPETSVVETSPRVILHKVLPEAPPIRPAERSALGTMPAGAFQYCEAMREATAYGWYVYPPRDISLLFDGRESFLFEDEQWRPIKTQTCGTDFAALWDAHAPDDLKGYDPPFLTELFAPGIVQIWSGYFIESREDWSLLIRPPVNYGNKSSFYCYEGIVETDHYKPCPLFVNIRLTATDREIYIDQRNPLFQIQPISRDCYKTKADHMVIHDGFGSGVNAFDWKGAMRTIRKVDTGEVRRPGAYAGAIRKR